MMRKALLFCGILSSLVYVFTDVVGALRYEGYSYTSQAISELGAIGSPVKPIVDPLFFTYDLLLMAFAVGVWKSAGQKRVLRVTASLLIGITVIGLVSTFFPMHRRGAEPTLTDTMHIILFSVIAVLVMVAIGFGATAFGKRFRLYSIGTILILLVCGTLTGLDAPRVQAQQPTPWLGVAERINVYGYLLWVAVLAITLSRARSSSNDFGRTRDSAFSG